MGGPTGPPKNEIWEEPWDPYSAASFHVTTLIERMNAAIVASHTGKCVETAATGTGVDHNNCAAVTDLGDPVARLASVISAAPQFSATPAILTKSDSH